MLRALRAGCVDLSSDQTRVLEVPAKIWKSYLGGRGIAAYLLFNRSDRGPNSGDSLIISAGLLSGTPAPHASWVYVSGQSPSEGAISHARMKSFLGPELRFAGFELLTIQGRASTPVYLWIHDGKIEVCEVLSSWGQTSRENQRIIRKTLGDEDVKVLTDGNVHQVNKDLGDLMKAKNLKAIGVKGVSGIEIANPKAALNWLKKLMDHLRASCQGEVESLACFDDENFPKPFSTREEARRVALQRVWYEINSALADSLGVATEDLIRLSPYGYEIYGSLIESVAGISCRGLQLLTIGRRIRTLERMFNLRKGIPLEEETGIREESFLSLYTKAHGWDPWGQPTKETLDRLGLGACES